MARVSATFFVAPASGKQLDNLGFSLERQFVRQAAACGQRTMSDLGDRRTEFSVRVSSFTKSRLLKQHSLIEGILFRDIVHAE
jgi:hypothetical protein